MGSPATACTPGSTRCSATTTCASTRRPRRARRPAERVRGGDRLPLDPAERRFADLDPFNQMLAVLETALHLELLAHRGAVGVQEAEGLVVYAAPPAPGRAGR